VLLALRPAPAMFRPAMLLRLSASFPSIAAAILFLVCPALAGPVPVNPSFTVMEGGSERVLRLVSPSHVQDTGSGEVWRARPEVTVAAGRAASIKLWARRLGALRWSERGVGGYFTLHFAELPSALKAAEELGRAGVEASPVLWRQRRTRFQPADPLYRQQWHLLNRGRVGAARGVDLNLGATWQSFRGEGIGIGIVDDGLQLGHPDLRATIFPRSADPASSVHYDFNRGRTDPRPGRRQAHGTAVAGLAAAAANRVGGLGVAPGARLAGLRLIGAPSTDAMEAAALQHREDVLQIYNNSWGPNDDGRTVEGPGPLALAALQRGALFGRGGRGSIFVWSGGNGRQERDDSNYDGYANAPETIAVGAVSDRGRQTSESESGANLLVVAPSSSVRRQGLVTTDLTGRRGYNRDGSNDGMVRPALNVTDRGYTNDFGMTSGAAPLVSGVVALMLQANPALGWREVQDVLIRTARRVDPADRGWRPNGAGLWFNHKYGAGLVDASAAVAAAISAQRLGGATSVRVDRPGLGLAIPDNRPEGVEVSFDLTGETNLRVEHVQFLITLNHNYRGDLHYELISPSGMVSTVAGRPLDRGRRLVRWSFMSVHHWGEESRGVWTLRVSDRARRDTGVLDAAELVVHGVRVAGSGS